MVPDGGSDLKLAQVLPDLVLKWKAVRQVMWNTHELQLRITRGLSAYEDQNALYGLGREKQDGQWVITNPRKIVTFAKGGESYHNFGLALDSCFMGKDPYLATIPIKDSIFLWAEYGRMCKEIGLTWGGDWKRPKTDRPHCEVAGLELAKVRHVFETQGIGAVFKYYNDMSQCGRAYDE